MNLHRMLTIIMLLALLLPLKSGLASENALEAVLAEANEPVRGQQVDATILLPEDTVRAREKHPGGTFWVKARKDRIERFRCSRCHNGKPFQQQINDGLSLARRKVNFEAKWWRRDLNDVHTFTHFLEDG